MCGIAVGTTGATCAVSDAQNPELFVKVLIVEVSHTVSLPRKKRQDVRARGRMGLMLIETGMTRSLDQFWVFSD